MSLHRSTRRTLLALLAAGLLGAAAPSAFAGTPTVDPSTLQPEPPPGASCRLDGRFVICQTEFHEPFDAEPVIELPCGTLYQTSRDDREGIRWYEDGLLVRRFVSRHMSGFWSLTPAGDGPRVTISGHSNWWTTYPVPGDEDSGAGPQQGSTCSPGRPAAASSPRSPVCSSPTRPTTASSRSPRIRQSAP